MFIDPAKRVKEKLTEWCVERRDREEQQPDVYQGNDPEALPIVQRTPLLVWLIMVEHLYNLYSTQIMPVFVIYCCKMFLLSVANAIVSYYVILCILRM